MSTKATIASLRKQVADLEQRLEVAARTVGEVRAAESKALGELEKLRRKHEEVALQRNADVIAQRDRAISERDQWKSLAVAIQNALGEAIDIADDASDGDH